eukprot:m.81988 g.81988  ORF g.81988 m.81988 type:complete len:86 (-) comp50763_c0_seq2:109-366(-)
MPVTESEFEGVSELIRGRVKLTEVNHTYEIVFAQFSGKRQSTPLTIANMSELGLRITGATGEAKLKVLRALKIISISKTGDVLLC